MAIFGSPPASCKIVANQSFFFASLKPACYVIRNVRAHGIIAFIARLDLMSAIKVGRFYLQRR
jgi:hypothetical protein